MDAQSAGAILRILNLIALADGQLTLEEEELLDSLSRQHDLQGERIPSEDRLASSGPIPALVPMIAPEHRQLTLKTAQMVARVSRLHSHDAYVSEEEEALLQELSAALALPEADQRRAIAEAEQELEQHPNLWQVLYGCFGASFDWPLLPG
jgi:tellurite resistance protein